MYSVALRNWSYNPVVNIFGLRYIPVRFSRSVYGGDKAATIRAEGNTNGLFGLTSMLGYEVRIMDGLGFDLWQGMIDSVTIYGEYEQVSVNLSQMYNAIYVQYNTEGAHGLSAVAVNQNSIDTYGTKELIYSGTDISTAAAALEYATQLVNYYGLPRVQRDPNTRNAQPYAEINAVGWFETLDWSYYTNTDTVAVATSTQIETIATAEGQFLNGVSVATASGISISPYQDGQIKAIDIIKRYLDLGVSGGNRYIAKVDNGLYLRVTEEPDQNQTYYHFDKRGRLLSETGYPIPPQTCPVGVWMKDTRNLYTSTPSRFLSDIGYFYIEAAEFDTQSGQLSLKPRGALDPADILEVNAG